MAKIEDIIARGTRAGQPTPTTDTQVGYLYYVTDENVTERWSGSAWQTYSDSGGLGSSTGSIIVVIDGGGAEIATGIWGDFSVGFDGTITAAVLLADQSGSIVIDIWNDTYANFAPTNADSITASAPPTISSATKSRDSTLTGWTTSLSSGDVLRFNVDSVTTIERVTLVLEYTS